jgi:hypothetical protein
MKRSIFLSAQRQDIRLLKSNTEHIISRIEKLQRKVQVLRELPTALEAIDTGKNRYRKESNFIGKLLKFFKPKEPTLGEALAEISLLQHQKHQLIKEISHAERYAQLLAKGNEDLIFSSDTLFLSEFASEEELKGFSKYLIGRAENLDRIAKKITLELNKLIMDKRARFRSIINLLFKNLDDEHSVLNTYTANAVNRNLDFNPHYGNPKLKQITCNSR